MTLLPGVYQAKKKDGSIYYRSSITYHNKHISLGSFITIEQANTAYQEANHLLYEKICLEDYEKKDTIFKSILPFEKWVVLLNFRDNGIYIKTPIYIYHRYFLYYLDVHHALKFDVDDLFYYSTHSIMKRGGHLFVSDYGMQVTILSRYGIKNYGVADRDYRFVNGDDTDYRYANIEIINHYHGVSKITTKGITHYIAKILIRGNYIIGRYSSEIEAAIAYNKAAKYLMEHGCSKQFPINFIDSLSTQEYEKIFSNVSISKKIRHWKLEFNKTNITIS